MVRLFFFKVETMKSNMSDRVRQMDNEAELLLAHWQQFKPGADVLQEDNDVLVKNVDFIRECRKKFEALQEQHEALKSVFFPGGFPVDLLAGTTASSSTCPSPRSPPWSDLPRTWRPP